MMENNSASLIDDYPYLVTYKAVDRLNGEERSWKALMPSESAARLMIADTVASHKNKDPSSEFHYVLTLSKDNVIIHKEMDAQ